MEAAGVGGVTARTRWCIRTGGIFDFLAPLVPMRIAMWSGPRNISTALMRSWGSRADTAVVDEPFYAHYLAATGADHPGREDVLAHHETDWRRVVAHLTGSIPGGRAIFYQKHMAHHLLPEMEGPWLDALTHAFLIRDPQEMLLSFARVVAEPKVEDLGLPQQVRLYDHLAAEGPSPPVVDARDVLLDPEAMLARLCDVLGVPFDGAMLRWAPGPRATDGVWSAHWYGTVEQSDGFAPYRPRPGEVPDRLRPVLDACQPLYDQLYAQRLTA